MILCAFLGNPGEKYARTRHNIAWRLGEELAARFGASELRAKGINARMAKAGELLLCWPLTYMNASGEAIAAAQRFYKPARTIVAHDEMELTFGRLKLQRAGSHGGHNGLKSVQKFCGDYERIRLGIGRPDAKFCAKAAEVGGSVAGASGGVGGGIGGGAGMSAAARECLDGSEDERTRRIIVWVLGEFTREQEQALGGFISHAADAAEHLIAQGLTSAQNEFNR